jgi:glycosyltransferase involved in cell wall biosynthesis
MKNKCIYIIENYTSGHRKMYLNIISKVLNKSIIISNNENIVANNGSRSTYMNYLSVIFKSRSNSYYLFLSNDQYKFVNMYIIIMILYLKNNKIGIFLFNTDFIHSYELKDKIKYYMYALLINYLKVDIFSPTINTRDLKTIQITDPIDYDLVKRDRNNKIEMKYDIIFIGNIEKRKNIINVLNVLESNCRNLNVGIFGSVEDKEILSMINSYKNNSYNINTSYLNNSQFVDIINDSKYVSLLYDGWSGSSGILGVSIANHCNVISFAYGNIGHINSLYYRGIVIDSLDEISDVLSKEHLNKKINNSNVKYLMEEYFSHEKFNKVLIEQLYKAK